MNHPTHILFAIFVILVIYEEFPFLLAYTPFIYAMIIAPVGALIPDLDHPNGYLSQGNWRIVSLAVRSTTRHRGWTHSILGAIIFTGISGEVFIYFKANILYTIPFFIGYISHLISDSLNPTGIKWLWPRRREESYKIPLIRTGSLGEAMFQNLLTFLVAGILFYDVMFNNSMLLR